jgi:flagellar hook assembly protein FlgD
MRLPNTRWTYNHDILTLYDLILNPFSKLTKISFGNEQSAESIELKIYDATGRLVKSFNLISPASLREAGRAGVLPLASIVCWDGTDKHGLSLPAGVYFIRLEGNDFAKEEKVILLK